MERTRRVGQLVVGCLVLSVGVSLLLNARLGSDGFSTFVNGAAMSTGTDFALVNTVMSLALVAVAWAKGLRPGVGTLVQPVVVGLAVSGLLQVLPRPGHLGVRVGEMLVGLVVLAVGVAGYLAADLGVGPAEALPIVFDPPVPFRWTYSALQVITLAGGWALGASVGPGTILVALLVGPLVDRIRPHLQR